MDLALEEQREVGGQLHGLRHHPQRLVEAGLWARTADGYAIHDFLKYNPSRAEQDAKRAAACERMAKGRRSSREVQANSQSTSQKQEETFARSSSVPIPIPFPKEKEEEGPPARAISTAPEAKAGDPSAAPLAWKALREAASERLNAGKAFATATGLPMAQEADWRRSWEQAREVYTLEESLRAATDPYSAGDAMRYRSMVQPSSYLDMYDIVRHVTS